MSTPLLEQVRAALGTVNDPEIKRPITDLGMVDTVEIDDAGAVRLTVLLTVSGCPLKDTINRDVNAAVRTVPGVTDVDLTLGVMSAEQRAGLKDLLSDGKAQRDITFAQPGSLTKVFAIASGKGGVGKSSVTVNLALAMAGQGLKVGVVDADIYGHSVPAMLGVADSKPTQVEDLIMPVPTASGVSVISIGMLKPRRDQVVAWRGPMLDRALVQMLSDVYWGDLDVLLLDLPPGTGDVAISLGQHLPGRRGGRRDHTAGGRRRGGRAGRHDGVDDAPARRRASSRTCPTCPARTAPRTGEDHRLEVFGSGGGERVAETLSAAVRLRRACARPDPAGHRPCARAATPASRSSTSDPTAPPPSCCARSPTTLAGRGRGLAGMQLGLTPAGRL